MLLKNKLLIFVIITLLASPIVSAEVCQMSDVLSCLKASLYNFFMDDEYDTVTVPQLQTLLTFYIGNQGGVTADCAGVQSILDTIDAAGECGSFSAAGNLNISCDLCSCGGFLCDPDTGCTNTTIDCGIDSDCGPNYYGDNLCIGKDVYRFYYMPMCNNPNTVDSYCALPPHIDVLIEICLNTCGGGACVCDADSDPCVVYGETGTCDSSYRCISYTNLVTNPVFLTDSNWIKGTGWFINTDCNEDGCGEWRGDSSGDLEQNIDVVSEHTYMLTYQVIDGSGPSTVTPSIGGQSGEPRPKGTTGPIDYITEFLTTIDTSNLKFNAFGSGGGSDDYIRIDSVFVYEILAQPP
jgi:hypothetical protein